MLTLILCVLVCVCVYVFRKSKSKKAHELPPAYPGALPLIGHTHMLFIDTAKLWLRALDTVRVAMEKGGVIHAVIGTQIYYLIADAQDGVTASNVCIQKHFAYQFVKPWLGNGILVAPENIWKHRRKMLAPAFSLPVIHGFIEVFNCQARKMTRIMEPHVGKGDFAPKGYIRKIMLETFCMAIFGNEFDDKNVMENYISALDTIMYITTHRFQTFWMHNEILFKLSGFEKKQQNAIEKLKMISSKIIEMKKAAMKDCAFYNNSDNQNATGLKYKTALELLLEQSKDETLTDEEIREELDNIIAPGFETLGIQIVHTLMFLGANPNVQNKLYEEILEVVGPDRDVSKEDINKLVYTNAVIMESIRMLPAAPVYLRAVEQDVKLKNYTMRAGSQLVVYPLMYLHDPLWGPSADKFIPERWLKHPKLITSKEFAGFGLGKRTCIGKVYAIVAMKVFLAHFIREYKVTADMSNLKFKIDVLLKSIAGDEISLISRDSCT